MPGEVTAVPCAPGGRVLALGGGGGGGMSASVGLSALLRPGATPTRPASPTSLALTPLPMLTPCLRPPDPQEVSDASQDHQCASERCGHTRCIVSRTPRVSNPAAQAPNEHRYRADAQEQARAGKDLVDERHPPPIVVARRRAVCHLERASHRYACQRVQKTQQPKHQGKPGKKAAKAG